jgi:hypothetical protein
MLVKLAATPAAIFKLFLSALESFKLLETIGNGQKPINRAFGAQFEVVRL